MTALGKSVALIAMLAVLSSACSDAASSSGQTAPRIGDLGNAPAPPDLDSGRVEVCEFFLFSCLHCYAFEPVLTSWAALRSDSVELVRVPALWNDVTMLHAQAYYTAEALGAVDTILGPFYAEIHDRGQPLATVADIRAFFVRLGIDGERFDATFDSAEVRADLRRAAELNRIYEVDSTPTIGVAGKYRTDATMAGSNETLFDVVDALVESESALRDAAETEPCAGSNDSCPPRLRLLSPLGESAAQATQRADFQ